MGALLPENPLMTASMVSGAGLYSPRSVQTGLLPSCTPRNMIPLPRLKKVPRIGEQWNLSSDKSENLYVRYDSVQLLQPRS